MKKGIAFLALLMATLVSNTNGFPTEIAAPTSNGSLPGKRVTVNGVSMHVFDEGSGRVVLLVHGMPDTSAVWKYQVPALLKAGYRVVAPDLIGYGQSDKPTALDHYRATQVVEDLIALLDAIGIKQVDYVGHDWGAQFGWQLIMAHPQRVRRFVTLTVGHPIVMTKQSMSNFQRGRWDWYMLLNMHPLAPELYKANNCAFFRMLISTHPEVDEVVTRLCNQPEGFHPVVAWDLANPMAEAWLAAEQGQLEKQFPEVKTPTLGIAGSNDAYLWESQVRDTGKYLKGPWHYELIQGASHWAMLDHPRQVTELILEWVAEK